MTGSTVLVSAVSDQIEQISRPCEHLVERFLILRVELEGEDARVLGPVIRQPESAPEDDASNRGAVQYPADSNVRNADGVPRRHVVEGRQQILK